jgi:hypothetical protein
MFDVGRSSFKPIPYGLNATCKFLQISLALMARATVPADGVHYEPQPQSPRNFDWIAISATD